MDNKIILKLASELLELASTEFSYHGCNDLDKSLLGLLSEDEKIQLLNDYHKFNNDISFPNRFESLPDWALMSFIAHKLKE